VFGTVRLYEMTQDWDDHLLERLDNDFVPAVAELAGFVAYYSLEAGARVFASVTIFEDRAGAEASNRLAAHYVQHNLADRFPSPPEITAGPVRASRVRPGSAP
jgi:hypothetical protein